MNTTDEIAPAQLAVGEVTGDPVQTVPPDATLLAVADALAAADIGVVVVGTPRHVQGVVSERDLVKALAARRDPATTTAADVASTTLVWAEHTAPLAEVAEEMMEHWVRHVLVEKGGHLVGVVSARDLLGVLASGGS